MHYTWETRKTGETGLTWPAVLRLGARDYIVPKKYWNIIKAEVGMDLVGRPTR